MRLQLIISLALCSIFFFCNYVNEREEFVAQGKRTQILLLLRYSGLGSYGFQRLCTILDPAPEVQTGQVITNTNKPRTSYLVWRNIPVNAKMVLTNNYTDPRCAVRIVPYICNNLGFYDPIALDSAACPNLGSSSFILRGGNTQVTCVLNPGLGSVKGYTLYFSIRAGFWNEDTPLNVNCSYTLELTE